MWQTHKPGRYWQERVGVFCSLSVLHFFFLLYRSCFVVTERCGMCNIPHTAIYAGQELWHFIYSVYGICKCTGRNYLYFSNVISLIWGEQYHSYQNLTNNAKFEFDFFRTDINGPQIWLCMGSKLTAWAFYNKVRF